MNLNKLNLIGFRQGVTITYNLDKSREFHITKSSNKLTVDREIMITRHERINCIYNQASCRITRQKTGVTTVGLLNERLFVGCINVPTYKFIGKSIDKVYQHGLLISDSQEYQWYNGSFKEQDYLWGTQVAKEFIYCGWFSQMEFVGYGQLISIHSEEMNNCKKKKRFRGCFKGGQLSGFGQVLQVDKDQIYCGRVRNHKRHGQGTLFADQYYYIGDFVDDKLHGKAIEVYQGLLESELQYFIRYNGMFTNGYRANQAQINAQLYVNQSMCPATTQDIRCILYQFCGENKKKRQGTYHLFETNNPTCKQNQLKAIQFINLKIEKLNDVCSLKSFLQYGFSKPIEYSRFSGELQQDGTFIGTQFRQDHKFEGDFSNTFVSSTYIKNVLKNRMQMKASDPDVAIQQVLNGYRGDFTISKQRDDILRTLVAKFDKAEIYSILMKHKIDGSLFQAEIQNGVRNGFSDETDHSGIRYKGYYVNNKKHGYGILSGSPKIHYEGNWAHDVFSGDGVLTMDSETFGIMTYKGMFANGLFHGEGILTATTFTYQGMFVNGDFHGKGIAINPISQYEGDFQYSEMHGQGIKKFKNGEYYQGQFVQGEIINGIHEIPLTYKYQGSFKNQIYHGHGRVEFKKYFYIYEGNYENGLRHGKGKEILSDLRYEGDFKNNFRHGKGVLIWNNGEEYDGDFIEDKQHGYGKFTTDKYTFSGQFIDDCWTNYGQIIYFHGAVYTGEHQYFIANGRGSFKYKGKEYIGMFKEGSLWGYGTILDLIQGYKYYGEFFDTDLPYGVMEFQFGKYLGELQRLCPHGKGISMFHNGNFEEGEWVEGKLQGQVNISYKTNEFSFVYKGNWLNDEPNGIGITKCTFKKFKIPIEGSNLDDELPKGYTSKIVYDHKDFQLIEYTYDGIFQDGKLILEEIQPSSSEYGLAMSLNKESQEFIQQCITSKLR